MPLLQLRQKSNRKIKPSTANQNRDTQTTKVLLVSKKDVGVKNIQTEIAENSTFINYTGNEYMQLRGSTAIMASSEEVKANPLAAIIVIMSIFLFMTLSVTAAVLVFCKKKNTVFTLQKCEQEDEISYEMDEMNNTDIEFAEIESELEAMQQQLPHMARKSATCPNLVDSIDREDTLCLQRLLSSDTGDSETDDGKVDKSLCRHPKLQRRSKSFTFQGSAHHGYQQMMVTAVMETSHGSHDQKRSKSNDAVDAKHKNFQLSSCSEINLSSDRQNMSRKNKSTARNLNFRYTSNIDAKSSGSSASPWLPGSDNGFAKFDDAYTTFGDVCTYFDDTTLAFLDTESEGIENNKTSEESSQKYFVTHVPCLADQSELKNSSDQSPTIPNRTDQSHFISQSADQSTSNSHKFGQSNTNSHLAAEALSKRPEVQDQSNSMVHISDQSAFSIACQSQNHSHINTAGHLIKQKQRLEDRSFEASQCGMENEETLLVHADLHVNVHMTDDENEVLIQ